MEQAKLEIPEFDDFEEAAAWVAESINTEAVEVLLEVCRVYEIPDGLVRERARAEQNEIKAEVKPKRTTEDLMALLGIPKPEEEEEDEDEDEEPEPEPLVALPVVRDEVVAPSIARGAETVGLLNQKHAVIGNYGGKTAVLSWEPWDINPKYLKPVFQSFTDFRNRYLNRYVTTEAEDGSVTRTTAGKYWLTHPRRLNYDGVGFDPSFEPEQVDTLPGNRINLWRGLAVKPKKGSWRMLLRHIYRVLGGGDPMAGRYIVRWLAWMFQNLNAPAETVLVFRGEEGAGKGMVARALLKIFGPYALPVSDPRNLIGAFSGHLHYVIFLFIDEAFWAGNAQAEGRLKSLITEETITIEPKYFAPFQARNMLHMIMSSNNDWVVPAGHGARRYAVFKVSDSRVGDFEYFEALKAEMDNGGIEAMLWDLLHLDLGDWHPRELYKTAALIEQKQHSLRGLEAWIESLLQAGRMPESYSRKYPNRCLSKVLFEDAKGYVRFTNETEVANKLKDVLKVTPFNNKAARGWVFPPLAECRKAWEIRNGGAWNWHHEIEEWTYSGEVEDKFYSRRDE